MWILTLELGHFPPNMGTSICGLSSLLWKFQQSSSGGMGWGRELTSFLAFGCTPGKWDLSSPTRDQTQGACIGNAES